MRGQLFLCLLLFSLSFTYAQKTDAQLQDLRFDVAYLASDLLQGRETGTEGEKLAAQYIAYRFEELGLSPKGSDGSWYQEIKARYTSNPHDSTSAEHRVGRNVIGFLDKGAATTVVIGAHYDHLGHGITGSTHRGDPAIHNGADDNASGVAGMLRLIEVLKDSKFAGHNNYLFIGFSAEEMGLYGSKSFVQNPTIELSSINYMINLDMIGRLNDERNMVVSGTGTSPVWEKLLEKISQETEIGVKSTPSGVGPSDHTSFYLKDIPVLFFFTGQHEDYHKPSDDSHLVNYEGLYDVTEFVRLIIEETDGHGKLEFTKTKDEQPGRRRSSFKVTLGVMPDYIYEGEGMRIDGVTEGKAASAAGLESGDVILQLGEVKISDMYSYMEALNQFNPGDSTQVVIKRGEEKISKEISFK